MEAAWHPVPGGTGRVSVDLARALSQRADTRVRGIAACHVTQPSADFRPSIDVTKLLLPRPLLYEAWSRTSVPRLNTSDHDIIHSTTIISPPASNKPLVVSVHDLAFRRFPERFPQRARRLFDRSWKRVLERADAVVCPSAATSADLLAAGLDADRLHLVPLGHEPQIVSAQAALQVRQKFGVDGDFILAAGTLEPRKNIPALIEAFSEIAQKTDTQLVLAGPTGWGTTVEELLGPVDNVTKARISITGEITTAELAALYTEATVFCYPSLLEGFGLPVLEAMSYRTPVVTSKGTSTEEVAGDAAVMVNPNSVIEISEALARLVIDKSAAREIGDAGYQRSKLFTWDKAASATVDIYRKLL